MSSKLSDLKFELNLHKDNVKLKKCKTTAKDFNGRSYWSRIKIKHLIQLVPN